MRGRVCYAGCQRWSTNSAACRRLEWQAVFPSVPFVRQSAVCAREFSTPHCRFRIFRGRGSAGRDRAAHRRDRSRACPPDAARCHRLRQDVHDGEGHRENRTTRAGTGPEQDSGCATLRRDARILPAQRGRVFRVVLRLLPARGLRSVNRHVYREGRINQRSHRADAAVGDEGPARTQRLHHRSHGVGNLWSRRPGCLPRDGAASGAGRDD